MTTANTKDVLLIGGGGREHALAWKLSQSPTLGKLWTTNPENPAINALAHTLDAPFTPDNPFRLVQETKRAGIDLVVIGPEDPLAAGLTDAFEQENIKVFGPSKQAAQLEADKVWAKTLMRAASVPMAEGRTFTDYRDARAYLETRDELQVIKAAGLAKGKGVIVPSTPEEGLAALENIMVKRAFGDAGNAVVIEEMLNGQEVSVLALVDGRTLYVLEPCQDHKRLRDNDRGPNTGGMGAYSPGGTTDHDTLATIEGEILVPTVDALRREGIDYKGILYAGVMLTPAGPKILEFNVRFGDPECQALMPRFGSDLLDVMLATCDKRLHEADIVWQPAASCCVVLASENYPAKPITGRPIHGIEDAESLEHVNVFHAGTKINDKGELVTAGGRVLSITATGDNLEEARDRAYDACRRISFDGMQIRSDIAKNVTSPLSN